MNISVAQAASILATLAVAAGAGVYINAPLGLFLGCTTWVLSWPKS